MQLETISIVLPDYLLEKADNLVVERRTTLNNLIKNALQLYIDEAKRKNQQMKDGYMYMANINVELAEYGMFSALEELSMYENELNVGD